MNKVKISDIHKSIVDAAINKIHRDIHKSNNLWNKMDLYKQLLDEFIELNNELKKILSFDCTVSIDNYKEILTDVKNESADVLNQMALLLASLEGNDEFIRE